MKGGRVAALALQAAPGLALVGAWQLFIARRPDLEFALGSPAGVLREGLTMLRQEGLLRDVGVTAFEASLGFLIGSLLGTMTGLLLWASDRMYLVARPYLVGLGSLPVFALGPVLIFWFGTGVWSKVVLGVLSTFVVAVVQSHTGAKETDPNLLRLIRVFGGSRRQAFWTIVVPSATIWVIAGIRVNIGMALLGAFVGEFISSSRGLGHLIIVAEGLYNVNRIWVGVSGIVIIALSFHALTLPIERRVRRWQA